MSDNELDESQSFNNFLAPLNLICKVTYEETGRAKVSLLKENYKETVSTNKDAIIKISLIIKDCIKDAIKALAPSYRNKLKQIYTDDGIITYLDYIFKQLMTEQLRNN